MLTSCVNRNAISSSWRNSPGVVTSWRKHLTASRSLNDRSPE